MRQTTLDRLREHVPHIDEKYIEKAVRITPSWTELRYLRTIASLIASGASKRDVALLWVIATMDGQYGFGLDIADHWESTYGLDDTCKRMRNTSLAQIEAIHDTMNAQAKRSKLKGRLKSVIRRLIP